MAADREMDDLCDAERRGARRFFKNIDEALKSKKPDIMRLLGTEGAYGEEIDLTKDWAARIIRHVGNYGEVYDRNVGEGSKLKIPRGLNQLWNAGGIQYAPPIR
jgi:general L-amino acid transport system substrate-binding protein